jgi:hypothetical protein
MAAELHFAEYALTLHLFLQRLEGLVDIIIANENLHAASSFNCIGENILDNEGPTKAKPSASRAPMYQIKTQMSTGGDDLVCGIKPKIQVEFPQKNSHWGSGKPQLGFL